MAGSVNKAIIIGNLGKDPEIRRMQSGDRVANLSVATSESWRDKQSGERKERTEWHRVVIMNDKLAEVAEKYLRKGSKVYVSGQIETREWTDKDGQKRYSTEIVLRAYGGELTLLDGAAKSDEAEGATSAPARNEYAESTGRAGRGTPRAGESGGNKTDLDDDIPF